METGVSIMFRLDVDAQGKEEMNGTNDSRCEADKGGKAELGGRLEQRGRERGYICG